MINNQEELYAKKGILLDPLPGHTDGSRCLHCDAVCELCCDVCPNRANVAIRVGEGFTQKHQILHIGGFCNECGNCGTFCPYDGLPYKDKLTVFWSREDFINSKNIGFLLLGSKRYLCRLPGGDIKECVPGDGKMPEQMEAEIVAAEANYPYIFNITGGV